MMNIPDLNHKRTERLYSVYLELDREDLTNAEINFELYSATQAEPKKGVLKVLLSQVEEKFPLPDFDVEPIA